MKPRVRIAFNRRRRNLLRGAAATLIAPALAAATAPIGQDDGPAVANGDRVVLLHGIARSAASLGKLANALSTAGYQTRAIDYPSRREDLALLAEDVWQEAGAFIDQPGGQTHFVTHSMGGLLARVIITRYRPKSLGRVVMLGPPNQGSEVADLLGSNPLYRWFFGPAGAELTTRQSPRLQALLGAVNYPLGIIAGDRAIDPLAWLLIPGPNDGRVAVTRTHVAGAADQISLHVTHALMMRNPMVIRQVIHFLRAGCFLRP